MVVAKGRSVLDSFLLVLILVAVMLNSTRLFNKRISGRKMGFWDSVNGIGTAVLAVLAVLGSLGIAPNESRQFLAENWRLMFSLFGLVTLGLGLRWFYGWVSRGVYSHLRIWYFGKDASPTRPSPERLVLWDNHPNEARMTSDKVDNLARRNLIKSWNTEPCMSRKEWLKNHAMSFNHTITPRDDELLDGSPSKFAWFYLLPYRNRKKGSTKIV